jgi:hypothetical protein
MSKDKSTRPFLCVECEDAPPAPGSDMCINCIAAMEDAWSEHMAEQMMWGSDD